MRVLEKILFVLVLISLISLLISILFFYVKTIPPSERYISLFVPADCDETDKYHYRYSICNLVEGISKKKKMNFTLDGNREENKQKLDMIQYEALKLKFTQDTSTVILINLTNDTLYGEFLSLYNICIADKHQRYGFWNDKFVIFGKWPKKKI